MSKLVVGLLGGGGLLVTAVIVGNHYLSKALESIYNLSSSVDDLKKEVKEDRCLQKTFPGLSSLDKTNLQDVNGEEDSKLGTDANSPIIGCLAINGDKFKSREEKHKDKWRGNFRFLWTFAKGNTGFLVYFTADTPETPPESNAKLKVKVLTHVLTKNTSDNTWSINKGKETEKEWEVSKLPELGAGLHLNDEKSKWKFAEEDSNLSKLCSATDCPYDDNDKLKRTSFFRGYWLWEKEKEPKETPDKWSSNLTDWWKEIYEESKWKIADTLKDIQGKWKAQGVFKFPLEESQNTKAPEIKST